MAAVEILLFDLEKIQPDAKGAVFLAAAMRYADAALERHARIYAVKLSPDPQYRADWKGVECLDSKTRFI